MALAFAEAKQNGPHKRVNKIARAVVDQLLFKGQRVAKPNGAAFKRVYTTFPGGVSDAQVEQVAAEMVSKYERLKNATKAEKLRKAPELFGRRDGKQFGKLAAAGKLADSRPALRAMRAKAKRVVAQMLNIPLRSAVGGKAHYLVNAKKEAYKLPWGATGTRRAVPHKPTKMWASKWAAKLARKHGLPDTAAGRKQAYRLEYEATKFGQYRADRVAFRKGSKQFKGRKWQSPIGPGVVTLGSGGPYKGSAHALMAAKAAAPRKAGKRRARRNVSALGGVSALGNPSALVNPDLGSVGEYLQGAAVPFVLTGAVGGVAHGFAERYGVTGKLADLVAKVPVLGPKIADNAPFTLQGVLVGAVLGFAAAATQGKLSQALAGSAAGVIASGAAWDVKDAFARMAGGVAEVAEVEGDDSSLVEADEELAGLGLGDLAFAPMGDLAFAPMGDLAFEAHANPHFRVASLSAPMAGHGRDAVASQYDQSSFADAYYSGADFSVEEGEALVNGEQAWCNAFGNPSRRMAGKKSSSASHHAGREGHRWGWMISLVGFQRAQAIAKLSPAKRLAVIKKLRAAAAQTYQQAMASEGVQTAAVKKASRSAGELTEAVTNGYLPSAGTIANGAMGASGHAGAEYLGDPVLFMGA